MRSPGSARQVAGSLPENRAGPADFVQDDGVYGKPAAPEPVCDHELLYAGRLELAQSRTQWRDYLRNGNWQGILQIIEDGVDAELANTTSLGGRTALMLAAIARRREVVAALAGVDGIRLGGVDANGNTALMWAAYQGHTEIVEMLLDTDVNLTDQHGDSPLLVAANKNHIEVARLLINAPGIDLNNANLHGLTALHCAALDNHQEILKLLLATRTINLNQVDENGHTALMLAAGNGHYEAVALLCIDDRIDIEIQDPSQQTARMLASKSSHPLVADLLRPLTMIDSDSSSDNDNGSSHIGLTCLSDRLCGAFRKRTARADSVPLITKRTAHEQRREQAGLAD